MVQIIDKREKDMSKKEKLRLEIMRTIAVGRGFNLRDNSRDYNFSIESNFSKVADFLLKRFNISFKDDNDETTYWPEKELKWPDKKEIIRTPNEKQTMKSPLNKELNPMDGSIEAQEIEKSLSVDAIDNDKEVKTEKDIKKEDQKKYINKKNKKEDNNSGGEKINEGGEEEF